MAKSPTVLQVYRADVADLAVLADGELGWAKDAHELYCGQGGVNHLVGPTGGSSYTDEEAQDAVGGILDDSGDVDFTYDDATPKITAVVKSDAVTYAKMQNVSAASKLLGRGSAGGAGDVQEVSLGAGLEMSGTTLQATGGGSPSGWRKFTKTYADFSAAATSNAIVLATLTPPVSVERVVVKQSTAFGGGGIGSYQISVGRTGAGYNDMILGVDVASAPGDGNFSSATPGTQEHFGAAFDVKAKADTLAMGNLSSATAGVVEIWIKVGPMG